MNVISCDGEESKLFLFQLITLPMGVDPVVSCSHLKESIGFLKPVLIIAKCPLIRGLLQLKLNQMPWTSDILIEVAWRRRGEISYVVSVQCDCGLRSNISSNSSIVNFLRIS